MTYKLGSLFDGSGGFPLAGSLCGIEPVWASEVEPYPIAVTRSRFPKMKHLGDISKINGAEVEPVDIITFGSPCQDLSVAGKRAGLKHEANGDEETTRSGLFMEAVRIIKEMRKATNGKYPSFALWENVPGAFSSNKGEDFRIVLQELIQIAEPGAFMPPVPKNGWPYADHYWGDGWSLCYRTFDAQYWGVPQRRRRIHLVLDLRGERAREVSFEREGVRGYFAKGGTAWQETAGDAEGGVGTADCGECVNYQYLFQPMSLREENWAEGDVKNAIRAGESKSSHVVVKPIAASESDVAATLYAAYGTKWNGNAGAYNGENFVLEPAAKPIAVATQQGGAEISENGICPTITAAAGMSGNNQPWICKPVSIENHPAGSRVNIDDSGKVQTLTSRMGTGGGNVPMVMEPQTVYCLQGNGIDRADTAGCNGKGWKEDTCYTLNTIDRPVANAGTKLWLGNQEAFSGDYHIIEETNPPAVRYIVRRLTPTECARLQGFPDKWGHPDQKEDLTDEEYRFWLDVRNTHATVIGGKEAKEYTKDQMLTWYNKLHTDSAEYKMWGNGIALPPALYLMQGMAEVLNAEEPTAL